MMSAQLKKFTEDCLEELFKLRKGAILSGESTAEEFDQLIVELSKDKMAKFEKMNEEDFGN